MAQNLANELAVVPLLFWDRSSGAEQGPFKPRVVGSNPTGLTHHISQEFYCAAATTLRSALRAVSR
jgi:hypothetical protein